jgi:hypothetical protein
MIEVGARLAGGRKAVMAEATVSLNYHKRFVIAIVSPNNCLRQIPNWRPFDAMVDAHCGFPVTIPHSFSPEKQAIHVYVPSDKEGIVTKIEGADFERLPTYYAHSQLAEVGKLVKQSKSLDSFAAQVCYNLMYVCNTKNKEYHLSSIVWIYRSGSGEIPPMLREMQGEHVMNSKLKLRCIWRKLMNLHLSVLCLCLQCSFGVARY